MAFFIFKSSFLFSNRISKLSQKFIFFFCDRIKVILEMQSIEKQIEKSIINKRKGSLFLLDDFLSYGSSDTIRKASI